MKKFILFQTLFLTALCSWAQGTKGKAAITVVSEQKAAVENATIELLRSKDSALVKTAITDNSGAASFDNLALGSYLFRASSINHNTTYSAPFTLTETEPVATVATLTLTAKAATQMQGVTVTARKPFIQKLNDRIVVNVENSVVSAGSSALDVLERSPGVSVDQNDAIGLRGKQGVTVMIDGKPTAMSGSDLANYLRGLPSNAIERIDIITNPSSKYDASGNSGIIDIRLKKDQRMGYNGTFTAGYGQGVYPKANGGVTFNYRNKKVNVFGNYNYSYRELFNHLVLNRNFFTNGEFKGSDDKDNYNRFPFKSHTARFGADFSPSKKTIVGFVVNSNFNHLTFTNNNHSVVSNYKGEPYFRFNAFSTSNNSFNNTVANINLKHTFDSTGKELTADVDYGVFNSDALGTTTTNYHNMDGSSKQPTYVLQGDQSGNLSFKTAKADYVHPIRKGEKLEAGVKTSFVSSENDAKFFDLSSGSAVNDETKTNHFLYDENNNAAYVNYFKEIKKFNMQLGLRAEQTNIKTYQVKGDTSFKNDYLKLFPSAFFNYKLKEDQTLGLSVSKRIDRPNYRQLDPFLALIDVSTYATGNPYLKPQMTWSFEASYTYKNLNFSGSYSHTKDVHNIVIVRFEDAFPNIPVRDSNVTVQIPVNLSTSDYYGFTVSAPVKVAKWWNMINNTNIYYNHFNGNLGGNKLNNGAPAADFKINNTFTFKGGWTAELNGNYNTGGRYGYMVSQPQWGLSTGVQKTVLKSKGTIRLNVSDIFWTNLPKATITYDNKYIENWHASRDSRVANLTFTYRFGNNKVQAARRRTTASEEETRRAN